MQDDNRPLAIHGGQPVRDRKLSSQVRVSPETRARILDLLDDGTFSGWYGGPLSREFEKAFSAYHGSGFHSVATNSGTSALHVACAVLELTSTDEVIVPAAAYQSAASVVVQCGAIPVIADVRADTLSLEAATVERLLTPRTRAVMVVHFFGCPTEMQELARLCTDRGVTLIEDCAQSHGARLHDARIGMFGDMACYSFAPRKHLATGEGGMVMTRSAEMSDLLRSLVNKGKGPDYPQYDRLGFSYVMPEFTALLGLDGLAKLDSEIVARTSAAAVYRERLTDSGLGMPTEPPWGQHVYFKFPILLPPASAAYLLTTVDALLAENVGCRQSHPPLGRIRWLREYVESRTNDVPRCPTADAVIPRLFEVDTGPWITEREAHLNADAVLKVWEHVRSLPSSPQG